MKRLLTYLMLVVALSTAHVVNAQDDDIATAFMKDLGDMGAKKKARLDSIDFQFAISVNENAGMVEIDQDGEKGAKMLYNFKDKGSRTPSEIASDTLELANWFYKKKMYKVAEASYLEVKSILEEAQLTNDINYIRCISSLGLVYMNMGRLNEASQYLTQALSLAESVGPQSAAFGANLNSVAKYNQLTGNYNEAEQGFESAVKVVKKAFGEKSMQYAIVLNNKAMLYQSMGRYDEGIALMKQSLEVLKVANKKLIRVQKYDFNERRFYGNLALMYEASGKLTEAETVFLDVKKVVENNGGQNNPEYAALINQLAILYMEMGKLDKVEPLLKKALEVNKKRLGEESPQYARTLGDLGVFYRISGKNAQAEPLLTKATQIKERVLGVNHPEYIRSKEELAILQWKMGKWNDAVANYKSVMDKTIDFINSYFPPMSEAEKTKYWDITSPRFQRFYNFALAASETNPEVIDDMFDYHTATKGLLLNSTSKIKRLILASKNKELINEYLRWLDKKESLARYYALSREELKNQNINLSELEAEANQMERSLSSKSADFSSGYSTQKISFKQIQNVLSESEAVVEVIRIASYDQQFTKDSKYVALVLTKGKPRPSLVMMENGGQLETRYAKFYRNAIQQKMDDEYSYDQYWTKIEEALAGKKTIYVSVDGAYNQINLNTLKKPGGDYVVKLHDLVNLGNSKDLIAIKTRKVVPLAKNATLLGFPDYGGPEINALPGTKIEIENLLKILKTGGYQTNSFMGKLASEKNLKAVKSPSVLHIATHGYFLQDVEEDGSAFGIQGENAANNPLLRSGLMLADAAKTVSGAATNLESNDNGILTAYEAMNLDLSKTSIIVISACETGLGDVKNGEGVYGLQRAFLVAGAETLIMSLWKVDDAATQELMTNFYSNFMKLGNKQKAFKQAQLQLMTKYKDPYYWGAFVMVGI